MSSLHQRSRPTATRQLIGYGLLACVLLLAAVLRLYRLDLIDFRFDQAYPLQYALDIANGRLWAVQPHGSLAVHPPVYLYVMALPYLVTRNFAAVITYRILLDVAAVGLCWLIGTRYFNRRVGAVSAALYAVAPWAIQAARTTWPVTQPLFSAILLIGLLEVVVRRNPWGWALTGWGLALCAGTHLAGAYVIPVVLVACWIGRKTWRLRPFLVGAAPLVVLAVVYVLYDATQQFANVKSLTGSFGNLSQVTGDALQFGVWMSGATHLSDLTGQAYGEWLARVPPLVSTINSVQVGILLLGVVVVAGLCVARLANHSGQQHDPAQAGMDPPAITGAFIVLLWWCAPIALQTRHSQPVMMQYMPVLLPAPFLIMAIGIDTLTRLAQRWQPGTRVGRAAGLVVGGLAATALLAVGAWHVAATLYYNGIVEQYSTGFGLPVRSAFMAAQRAKQAYAEGIRGDVVVVVPDYVTPWHQEGVILNVVLADVPHRFLNSYVDGWIFRSEGTSYIFAPGTDNMLRGLLSYVAPGDVITAVTPLWLSQTGGYTYVQLKRMPDLSQFTQARPTEWENGLELANYRVVASGNTVRVEEVLRVLRAAPDNVDYHWYNHLFDGDKKLAQADGSGIHPLSWRAGDFLLQRFDIPLSEALPNVPLHVRIGSYTFPEPKSVLVQEDGKAPENGVNLPLPYPLP